jgi:hypothetical protein
MKHSSKHEITEFFQEIVGELNSGLADAGIDDGLMWELSRRLHAVWRAAMKRARPDASPNASPEPPGHPALEELLRLANVEVRE